MYGVIQKSRSHLIIFWRTNNFHYCMDCVSTQYNLCQIVPWTACKVILAVDKFWGDDDADLFEAVVYLGNFSEGGSNPHGILPLLCPYPYLPVSFTSPPHSPFLSFPPLSLLRRRTSKILLGGLESDVSSPSRIWGTAPAKIEWCIIPLKYEIWWQQF